MAIEFEIDVERKLVHTVARGDLSLSDLRPYLEQLRADPRFDPSFSQLFDVREGLELKFDTEDLRRLAVDWTVFAAGSWRAFVVSSDVGYGLGRMFQVFSEAAEQEVRVFRDIDEARAWLALRPREGDTEGD